MGADLSFAKKKLAELESLEPELNSEEVAGLFDHENLQSLAGSIKDLRARIRQNEEEDRLLRIGIVGDVKAGKSSFLNASIFDGKDFLPKAATPMTAALTRITYNERSESEAIIYFYTQDDWSRIEQDAMAYDEKLDALYNEYLEQKRKKEENARQGHSAGFAPIGGGRQSAHSVKPPLTKEKYEESAKNKIGNSYCIAKEIVRDLERITGMKASSADVLDKLGTHETIPIDKANLSQSLDMYVGAKGKYTPIVSYVELKIHDDVLKGFEIIDTPGLNDPIQSRCKKTKEFLGECNVAILLSTCSQFMGESTVRMMVNRLPSKNVAVIQVVGSQMDAGMMDLRGKFDLEGAYRETAASCRYDFRRNVENAKKISPSWAAAALKSLEENDVIFTSAMCYMICQKHKNKEALTGEENKYFENLCSLNKGKTVSDEKLLEISGVRTIQDFLEKQRAERARILEADSKTFLEKCTDAIRNNLETICIDARRRKGILEKSDIHTLRTRKEKLETVLDSSRARIQETFQLAALEAKRNGRIIKDEFALMQVLMSHIETETQSKTTPTTRWTGLFGWHRETVMVTVTNHSAETAQVIQNIAGYISNCTSKVKALFGNDLLNEERLQNELKNIFLAALGDDSEFDSEDILSPIRLVLGKIKVPEIDIEPGPYIDEINDLFPEGVARNEAIHKLALAQQMAFCKIAQDLRDKLEHDLDEIEHDMMDHAASFADNVKEKLSGSFAELEAQMKDKETSRRKYDEFIAKFTECKKQLKER